MIFEVRGCRVVMQNTAMRLIAYCMALVLAGACCRNAHAQSALTLDQAVALAKKQNPEIVIARKQLEGARGTILEARSG